MQQKQARSINPRAARRHGVGTKLPSPGLARWADGYAMLAGALEKQLERSRAFVGGIEDDARRRLHENEMTLLSVELDAARGRLAHWRQAAGPRELTAP